MSKVTDITIKPACIEARGEDGAYTEAVTVLKRTYDNFPKDGNYNYRIELHIEHV